MVMKNVLNNVNNLHTENMKNVSPLTEVKHEC